MKHIKTQGLAVLAAMALMASISVGNASATALEVEGSGTNDSVNIEASLASGTSVVLSRTDGSLANTCTASSVAGDTEEPFSGTTVTGAVDSLSFTSCERTVTVHKPGTLHVEHIASTTNGTVSSSGAEVTVGSPFGTLNCKTGAGVDIGILTGTASGSATMDINAVLNCGFLVPSAKWEGTYTVASPAGLGVVLIPNIEYRSKTSPVTFFGAIGFTQSSVWEVEKSKATCTTGSFESPSTTTPAKSILLAPAGTVTCADFFGRTGKNKISLAQNSGCKFELQQPQIPKPGDPMESTVSIRCDSGKSIRLHGEDIDGTCEVLIGEGKNDNLARATYKNLGGNPSKFEVVFELSGITAEVKESTNKCPLTKGVTSDVTYKAQVNIEDKAKKDSVSVS